jgi:Na+/H+-translocating membrane pyrophosphatase
VLAGSLVSGVQMAVSMSNTGGAWDNAKKYVEAGASEHARELGGKGSDCHKVSLIGCGAFETMNTSDKCSPVGVLCDGCWVVPEVGRIG